MKPVVFCLLLLLSISIQAQTDWKDELRRWMNAEDMEAAYSEEVMEQLAERAEQPINLNQTSREELEQLPFLTAQQVEGIIMYLDRYHPIRTLNELRMITALDYDVRSLLTHFVYCGEEAPKRVWPQWADVAKYGRHKLTATVRVPFYQRQGDRNGYLGYKYRHDLRYQFNYKNRIKFGLTGAQDAGEPFFSNKNTMGYDHYAVYFQLRGMGRLEELNLGTYRVQMGLGLVMNTGFHLGKLASLQSLGRSSHTLTAHSSRSGSNYLQGAAATVRIARRWKLTAFASFRAVDATLNADGTVRTLLTDGYHRTPTELEKKNNTHQLDLGSSIGWRKGTAYVSANTVFTHFDRRLLPQTTTLYRRYAASGNDFFNLSLDYGYNTARWGFSGETAVNRQGALATLHTLSLAVSPTLHMMALHRYYDKRYTALHAHSVSEGSGIQNEHGIYLGTTWKPAHAWTIQGYLDYAHFSWPRYQVSAASDAFDGLLSVRHSRRQWTLEGRYRLHIRQQDDSHHQQLINKTEHRLRLSATWAIAPRLSLRTQADGVAAQTKEGRERGLMLTQHATCQWRSLKMDGHVGWFHTDDYDSRIYQYEPSALHDFSFPMYYGHGLRYSFMLTTTLIRRLTATLKVGTTRYFDRSTIGSALQQVAHSSMTDLLVQLRFIL